MGKITIVTGFYNIDREDWTVERRSDEVYFKYFEHWARIQNQLIVYVEHEEHKKKVESIREKFGLSDKTTVIVTGSPETLDKQLYERIQAVNENSIQIDFHIMKHNPEAWNANYNYIVALKSWFLNDALEKNLIEDTAVWLDFGFGHGSYTYADPEEFSFEWHYEFPQKVNMYYIKELDGKPVFDLVRTGEVYFCGCMMAVPKEYIQDFWKLMRSCMSSLLDAGLVDDDQTIQYMAYYTNPELFYIEKTEKWFVVLKEHGGEHLTLQKGKAQEKESMPVLRSIVRKMRNRKENREYTRRMRKYLNHFRMME